MRSVYHCLEKLTVPVGKWVFLRAIKITDIIRCVSIYPPLDWREHTKKKIFFRITRSDMNCQRVKYILRGLTDCRFLETLDFSHCKIGDEGAAAIAKFISKREYLRNIVLMDNIFGKINNNIIHYKLKY